MLQCYFKLSYFLYIMNLKSFGSLFFIPIIIDVFSYFLGMSFTISGCQIWYTPFLTRMITSIICEAQHMMDGQMYKVNYKACVKTCNKITKTSKE